MLNSIEEVCNYVDKLHPVYKMIDGLGSKNVKMQTMQRLLLSYAVCTHNEQQCELKSDFLRSLVNISIYMIKDEKMISM